MRFPAHFWGKFLKNLLQFLFQSGMLYPTKAKLGYIFTLEQQIRLRTRLCFYLAIFFIYLLIIYPACPARDEKSDDPPARVVAFSFIYLQKQNAPTPHAEGSERSVLERRKKKETRGTPAQFPPVGLKHRSGGCGTPSALPKCSIIHKVLSALLA